jgi:hypothetical protein
MGSWVVQVSLISHSFSSKYLLGAPIFGFYRKPDWITLITVFSFSVDQEPWTEPYVLLQIKTSE